MKFVAGTLASGTKICIHEVSYKHLNAFVSNQPYYRSIACICQDPFGCVLSESRQLRAVKQMAFVWVKGSVLFLSP